MITASGVIFFTIAAVIKLFASTNPGNNTKLLIVLLGGCGIGMLIASVCILSMRYLP